jgi:hypothetical protein
MMVFLIAPVCVNSFTSCATVDLFWPMATYTQYTRLFLGTSSLQYFWWRMQSTAMAVFPV